MSKNTPVQLISFVGLILAGLVISQLVLFLSLTLSGNMENIQVQDSDKLINQLSSHQLLNQQLISQVFSLILPSLVFQKLFIRNDTHSYIPNFEIHFLLKALLLFFLFMPLVGFSSYLNQLLPAPDWVIHAESRMLELMEKMFQTKSANDFLIALIVIAIIPAIAEEWAFRGILQNLLIKLSGKNWFGLLIASVIFSAVHMQFLGFLPRFLLGWILGFVYLRSGHLGYSIILHFLNNAIQLIAIYTIKENTLHEILEKSEMPNIYALLVCTLFAAWVIRYFFKSPEYTPHA